MKLLNLLMENDNGFNLKVGSTDKFDIYLMDDVQLSKVDHNRSFTYYMEPDCVYFYLKPINKKPINNVKYLFVHYLELGVDEMLLVKGFNKGRIDFAAWELYDPHIYHTDKDEITTRRDIIKSFEIIKSFLSTKSDDMLNNIL